MNTSSDADSRRIPWKQTASGRLEVPFEVEGNLGDKDLTADCGTLKRFSTF